MNGQPLALPYSDEAQRHEASWLGMWIFLASEIMLFGGLFFSIMVYRVMHGPALEAASGHLNLWLGGLNTAVLLTSSLAMALAVHAAREEKHRHAIRLLLLTAALGALFLGIKGYEYWREYQEGQMPGVGPASPLETKAGQLFFNMYFAATGLHAVHLACGILALLGFASALGLSRLRLSAAAAARVEGLGMYWHLVDVIWVFLYPALYLI
jgi:cytochrome c oxidase subunit 3